MRVAVAALIPCVLLGGCALNPYHGEFMCAASQDHGKCETVEQAYAEALAKKESVGPGGASAKGRSKGTHRPDAPDRQGSDGGADAASGGLVRTSQVGSGEERYRDAEYRRLAALVEEPVTPIVQPPKVLRTLVLSYGAGESLYMPRYLIYFAEVPKFVLGDYLNPDSTPKTVYPKGGE